MNLRMALSQAAMPVNDHIIHADATELENFRLQKAAVHDQLTGTLNRRHLDEEIPKLLSLASRSGQPLSIVMLDLDHFKQVNDLHGHIVGDHVLQEAAKLVGSELRQHELLYRNGGEEFTIVLPGTEGSDAAHLAERIRSVIAVTPFEVGAAEPLNVTVSMGIASYPKSAASIGELFEMADKALYLAKESGRNCVKVINA